MADIRTQQGKTPLLTAASNGHHDPVRALLAYGANINATDNKLSIMQQLEATGRRVFAILEERMYAHDWPIYQGRGPSTEPRMSREWFHKKNYCRLKVTRILGRHGAHCVEYEKLYPVRRWPKDDKHWVIPLLVEYLTRGSTSLNRETGKNEKTPLIRAVRAGNYAKAQFLILAGADPCKADKEKMTPLAHTYKTNLLPVGRRWMLIGW
ncbi:ankyrin repeat-containing domain protein [Aspergillus filifer]